MRPITDYSPLLGEPDRAVMGAWDLAENEKVQRKRDGQVIAPFRKRLS